MSECFVPRYSSRCTARGNFTLKDVIENIEKDNKISRISFRKLLPDYTDIETENVKIEKYKNDVGQIKAYSWYNDTLVVWRADR